MPRGPGRAELDPRLRRARTATLVVLAPSVLGTPTMPAVGLFYESRPLWVVLGAVGITLFVATFLGALYAVVTPWLAQRIRTRLFAAFVVAAVASVPLVAPVGAGSWQTWAWLGAAIVGLVPLIARPWLALLVVAVVFAVSVGVALATGGTPGDYLAITAGVGIGAALVAGLPVWLWDLLLEAERGRAAVGRLAATEERLRFARDVHDLLGHNLSVIALKAELATRLAPTDPEAAARSSAEVQHLAVNALREMREVVHGYREIDLNAHIAAVEEVLGSSGLRCTVLRPDDAPDTTISQDIAVQVVAVLREASTNVLRHSTAGWCTIEIVRQRGDDGGALVTIVNDGANGRGPDALSYGLRGLAERLHERGGELRTHEENGVFTLAAVVR